MIKNLNLNLKSEKLIAHLFVSIFQETEEIEDMIADGLSQLGRSADGTLQVYLNLFLAVSRFWSC